MRKILILIFLVVPGAIVAQTMIASGEYWFDSDRDSKQEILFAPDLSLSYSTNIDISMLDNGLHTCHIRFRDDSLRWSGTVSRFFVKLENETFTAGHEITHCQYWFDSDLSSAVNIDISNTSNYTLIESLDIEALATGLHSLHLRFADNQGRWSSALSRYFVKIPVQSSTGPAELTELEYWIDNYPGNLTSIVPGGTQSFEFLENVDLSQSSPGLHRISFRFKDNKQLYSSPVTRYFVNMTENKPLGNSQISGYRYWFSDSVINEVILSTPASTVMLDEDIDMRLMERGEYIINIQIRDSQGTWSGTISDTLDKISYPYALLSSGSDEACANDSLVLSSLLIDADSISWNFGDGSFSSLPEVKKSWDAAGSYSISASIYDRINDLSATFQLDNEIVINPLPVINIADSLKLTTEESGSVDAGDGFTSYLWNGIEGSSQYTFYGSELGTGNHEYSITVENEYGCTDSDTIIISVSQPTGIEDLAGGNLKIYPNPVRNFLHITWKDIDNNNVSITVIDNSGRLFVGRKKISPGQPLDLSMLGAGRYFIVLDINKEIISIPIIKL